MELSPADRTRIALLLDTWFGPPGSAEYDQARALWYKVDPAFDALLRTQFLGDQQRAAAGGCAAWAEKRDPALALMLLLDQLPRNLYRGTAQAFASDALARTMARRAIAHGFDQAVSPVRRSFFYLPFEHSEELADQEQSLRLFAAATNHDESAELLIYARRHHDIIARFGRFPHRNHILGRISTPEEEAFLKEPNSSF
jgi:uncharacterized protein (DUF924 family)